MELLKVGRCRFCVTRFLVKYWCLQDMRICDAEGRYVRIVAFGEVACDPELADNARASLYYVQRREDSSRRDRQPASLCLYDSAYIMINGSMDEFVEAVEMVELYVARALASSRWSRSLVAAQVKPEHP